MSSVHHSHSHEHLANSGSPRGRNLFAAVLLNLLISFVEFAGGIISNSLALLSDALHNFSDGISSLIAYIALRVSLKKPNMTKTFGYRRIEIMAALFNAVTLIAICIYLFFEAYKRFADPQPIGTVTMLIVAVIGLAANFAAVFLLHKDKNRSMNIRAAYLHLLGDTMSSVAFIAGAVVMFYWEVYWLDPVLTILIGLYILKEAYSVTREAVDILMQAAPKDMDIDAISSALKVMNEIAGIHHVHLWSLDDRHVHFECHLELSEDMKVSETNRIIAEAGKMLYDRFGIGHVTLQVEYRSGHKGSLIV